MLDVNYFDELRIGLATAEQIRMWSNGEVRKPDDHRRKQSRSRIESLDENLTEATRSDATVDPEELATAWST